MQGVADRAVAPLLRGEFGKHLGLDNDFTIKVHQGGWQLRRGFAHHVGSGSRLRIERDLDKLLERGVQYAPPV
jgi:hypothetical protein